MRTVAIILANIEFNSAFFLNLKIHKAEIAIDNSLMNLMLRISKKQNSNFVKKYDL